jgi:predicted GNAT family acetyltransferase
MTDLNQTTDVVHNKAAQQFELRVGERLCVLQYRITAGKMVIYHTEVPHPFEGRGLAAQMTRAALEFAQSEQLHVDPRCPYTAAFFRKHPEYSGLLH